MTNSTIDITEQPRQSTTQRAVDALCITVKNKTVIALAGSAAISLISLLIAWQSLRVATISLQSTLSSSVSDKQSRLHAQVSEAQHINYEMSSRMYSTMVNAIVSNKTDATYEKIWELIAAAHALRAQLYELEAAIPKIESVQDLDTLSHRLSEVITVIRGLDPYANDLLQYLGRPKESEHEILSQASAY